MKIAASILSKSSVKPNVGIVGMKGLPAKGGAERVAEEILSRLHDKIDFTVYCYRDYTPPTYRHGNINFVRLPFLSGKIVKPVSFLMFSVLKVLTAGKHDIIHLHNAEAGFILPLLRIKYKYIISTAHGPGYDRIDKWNNLERLILHVNEIPFVRCSSIVTSVKKELADYYLNRYNVPARFIPNGVDSNPQINADWVPEFLDKVGVNNESFILFISGRIIPTKGAHILLKAYEQIDTKIPLIIVGEKGYVKEYDTWIDQLIEHTNDVFYHPLISDKSKVLGLIKSARFLVFPSSVEAMSMVLLEAASLATPVICSDIPENVAVMKNSALYFKVDDPKDLADRIIYALQNEEKIGHMAAAIQQQLFETQSWDKIALHYLKLYLELKAQKDNSNADK